MLTQGERQTPRPHTSGTLTAPGPAPPRLGDSGAPCAAPSVFPALRSATAHPTLHRKTRQGQHCNSDSLYTGSPSLRHGGTWSPSRAVTLSPVRGAADKPPLQRGSQRLDGASGRGVFEPIVTVPFIRSLLVSWARLSVAPAAWQPLLWAPADENSKASSHGTWDSLLEDSGDSRQQEQRQERDGCRA